MYFDLGGAFCNCVVVSEAACNLGRQPSKGQCAQPTDGGVCHSEILRHTLIFVAPLTDFSKDIVTGWSPGAFRAGQGERAAGG